MTRSHQLKVPKFFAMGITFLNDCAAYFSYCLHNSLLSLKFLYTGDTASPSCAALCLKSVLSTISGESAQFRCFLDHKVLSHTCSSISTQLPLLNHSLQLSMSRYSGDVVCRCWNCRIIDTAPGGRGLLGVRECVRMD